MRLCITHSEKEHIHTEYSKEINTISFQINAIFDRIARDQRGQLMQNHIEQVCLYFAGILHAIF
ncbi:hypothetical protein GCM10007354_13110 [Acinetobacter courvalinii]|uniref:Uncharacterized protein n=1 Tax=Acinetobacter courvalinii TaxID=280147 RepID=A0ABD0A6T0_9GAMM|nr:hypothetical protein GCM10007354_13110 [Acinetobacter courvalinii]